jgi:hypothetical protein
MPRLEGVEPPFGPIYNLSQDELVTLIKIHWWKPWKRFHSTFQVSNSCPNPIYQEEGRILLNLCQLPWAKSTHHQELIFATFHFKIIGSTQSCQGVHQDQLAWCIQLGVYLKKWQMEDCIPYTLWPLALWMHLLSFDISWTIFFMNTWMILWFVTLMTSSNFSKNLEEHEWHVRLVLDKLREVGLYAKLEKCEFHQTKVEFLSCINLKDGVHMDSCKVQTIMNWVTPNSIHDV